MTIRATICTLTVITGSVVSGCSTAQTRFGVHAGAENASETRTATFELPGRTVYYDPNPFITEHHVAGFSRSRDANGNPALSMELSDQGTEIMREWSGQNVGNYAVLTLEGEVLSAPVLITPIGRRIQVTTGTDRDALWIDSLEAVLQQAGATETGSADLSLEQ
ncbi:MAG: SecDF P1 head subdomain-containing protein [Phycisphaerales bacterium JB065]